MGELGVVTDVSEAAWQCLKEKYSETSRSYHTLVHLCDLLTQAEGLKEKLSNYTVVRLSIFYHDIIYDARSPTNEEQSAELFLKEAEVMGLDTATMNTVREYILATKVHMATATDSGNNDLPLFIDMDMSILGTEELVAYKDYTRKVRQEYIHLDDATWCAGRTKFLQSTLEAGAESNKFVFITPQFRAQFEAHAKRNMLWELHALRGSE